MLNEIFCLWNVFSKAVNSISMIMNNFTLLSDWLTSPVVMKMHELYAINCGNNRLWLVRDFVFSKKFDKTRNMYKNLLGDRNNKKSNCKRLSCIFLNFKDFYRNRALLEHFLGIFPAQSGLTYSAHYSREQIMYGSPSWSENRSYLDLSNFQARIKFWPSEEFSNGDSYFKRTH